MVESTPKSETRFVDLPAEAGAATHTSDEISLAATAGRLTSAEVSPAPTAEELAEVPAESQTCEEVAVEPTPLLVTQSVDVTAADGPASGSFSWGSSSSCSATERFSSVCETWALEPLDCPVTTALRPAATTCGAGGTAGC